MDKEKILASKIGLDEKFTCGVYFLIHKNEIVYVGKSKNIYSRLEVHKKDGQKIFDSYTVVECDESQLNKMESDYIYEHLPKYNKAFPTKDTNYQYIGEYSVEGENCKIIMEGIIFNNKLYLNNKFQKWKDINKLRLAE